MAWTALTLAAPISARAAGQQQLQILVLGSSLARGVRGPLKRIFALRGIDVTIRALTPGLATLADHVASVRTERAIAREAWDIVFLQGKGEGIRNGDGYPHVRQLFERIAPTGAKTMLFMTWRERDTPPFDSRWDELKGEPGGLVGYVPIAHELDISVAPVGWAVRQSRIELGDPPAWDLWRGRNGRHLGRAGRYLASCTVYTAITGLSARGVWAPGRLDPATADFLQTVATDVVMSESDTWNLPAGPVVPIE